MLLIVGELNRASPRCLIDSLLHGVGDLVGIHYDCAIEVTRRTPHRLCKGSVRTEESLLVGVKDSHQ